MSIVQIPLGSPQPWSYGSVAELDAYVLGSILPTGVTFTSSNQRKLQLLVTATRYFERTGWIGTPTDLTTPQPLAWPRTGVVDRNGQAVADSVLPADVEAGFFELVIALDQDTTGALLATGSTGSNTKRTRRKRKVGELETEDENENFVSTATGGAARGRFPQATLEFIKPFLKGGAFSAAGFASGADECSQLEDSFGFRQPGLP